MGNAAGLRVLVVDDEPLVGAYLLRLGAHFGLEATVAESGALALEISRRETFDLLVVDLLMPGISGLELLRLLRQENNWTPALIFTSHPSVESALEAGRLGAVSYQEKVITGLALVEAMWAAASVSHIPGQVCAHIRTVSPSHAFQDLRRLLYRVIGEIDTSVVASAGKTIIRLVIATSLDDKVSVPQFAAAARILRGVLTAPERIRDIAKDGLPLVDNLVDMQIASIDPVAARALTTLASNHILKEGDLDVALHPSTVGRRIVSALGIPFQDLRWAARVRSALAPLALESGPIRHVAVRCGYDTYAQLRQFDRDFQRVTGVAPSTFRRLTATHGA